MKELSIEEKAKAYDKALEEAKKWHKAFVIGHNYPATDIKVSYEWVFPELKESEGDRIRKRIIQALHGDVLEMSEMKDCLVWLEKQGEKKSIDELTPQEAMDVAVSKCFEQDKQKLAEEVKPKFKVGDWIIFAENHNSVYQVERIDNYRYYLRHYLGGTLSVHFDNELIRLWTIQDAKDGDVLVNGSNIFIFHFINDTRLMGYCHVNIDNGRFYDDIGKNECFCLIDAVVTPATKEQRDLLFQKMKEAGYEWDAEKKEPKKIKQNPTWSEEDEKTLEDTIRFCELCGNKISVNWLKSLKDRVQPKQEWSEEDSLILSDAIFFVREYQIPSRDKRMLDAAKRAEEWLKNLSLHN